MDLNFFEDLNNLEPKCPGCNIKVDYGVTTKYDNDLERHICLTCGHKF